MKFEWDEQKAIENEAKHEVSFASAMRVFENDYISFEDARFNYGETRWKTIGMLDDEAIIVVIHTDRSGKIRIISARKANKNERQILNGYHNQNFGRA